MTHKKKYGKKVMSTILCAALCAQSLMAGNTTVYATESETEVLLEEAESNEQATSEEAESNEQTLTEDTEEQQVTEETTDDENEEQESEIQANSEGKSLIDEESLIEEEALSKEETEIITEEVAEETQTVIEEVAEEENKAVVEEVTEEVIEEETQIFPQEVVEEENADAVGADVGTCGEGVTWSYEDGTLTISGTGAMSKASDEEWGWEEANLSFSKLVIEDGVTSIEKSAFYTTDGLSEVTMADSVEYIGGHAFYGCKSLKEVKLPSGLQELHGATFSGCENLNTINIPKSLKNVEQGFSGSEFGGCPLSNISFEEGITEIAGKLFKGSAMTSIEIPETVTVIGASAFSNAEELQTVKLPSNLNELQGGAFYCCKALDTINIPKSLKNVGTGSTTSVFASCPLTNVTFEEGITEIPENMFKSAAFTEIEIPATVERIGSNAFRNTKLEKVKIPNSVTEIGECAFQECESLTEAELSLNLSELQGGAFYHCEALDTINIPKSLKNVGTGSTTSVFASCPLTNVTFEEGITEIPENMFKSAAFTEIEIPATVERIGSNAFRNTKLEKVKIPNSVTEIGECAFQECESLTEAELSLNLSELQGGIFYHCEALETINIPKNIESVGISGTLTAFASCPLTNVTFEEGIEHIAENMFRDSNIKEISLPSTIQTIGENAFKNCDMLTKIVIPERTTIIADNSFNDCDAEIHAMTGSYAEEYARQNKMGFSSTGIYEYGLNTRYDGYSFANSNAGLDVDYTYPIDIYKQLYKLGNFWSYMLPTDKAWDGRAYGMSITASKLSDGQLTLSDYITDLDITHEVANANDIYKMAATENGKHYKYVTSESKLNELIEKYQLSQGSVEYRNACTRVEHLILPEGGMAEYFNNYVKMIREKEQDQIMVVFRYELDSRESSHSVMVDTSRYPANLGDGWIRIFLYNPDTPYFGDESTEEITPLYANKDAMSCYVDVNVNDGSWRTQLGTTQKEMGSDILQSYIVFVPGNELYSITDDTKLTSLLQVTNESVINVEFTGDNIEIYNSETNEEVYKLSDGKQIFSRNGVIFNDYYEINSENADVSGYIMLEEGKYNIVLTDGHIAMGHLHYYFSVETDEKVTIEASEIEGFKVISEDEKSNVKVSIANRESDNKYIAYRTALEVDDKGCNISLADRELVINTDCEQIIDIDVLTEEKETTLSNVSTSTLGSAEEVISGTCGEGVTWSYEAGTLTISGTGAMSKASDEDWGWEEAELNIRKLVIEDGVTKIEKDAFYSSDSLTEVIMADSVTEIGASAFSVCKNLTKVTLSKNLEELQGATFHLCEKLETINIPKSLKAAHTTGALYADFTDCPLSNVIFEEGTTEIADELFKNSAMTSIEIPETVTRIGKNAFASTDLTEIKIPDSVTEIGAHAFSVCKSLTKVTLSKNLEELQGATFHLCEKLETINIPKSLKAAHTTGALYADFTDCPLSNVTFEEGAEHVAEELFANSNIKEISLPATIQTIEKKAFENCDMLTKVVIPERTTIIADNSFSGSDITIHAMTGSYAEEYTRQNKINFVSTGNYEYGLNTRYDGYSFANSNAGFDDNDYTYPANTYKQLFSLGDFWSYMSVSDKAWDGKGYGMSITASKFSDGQLALSDYITDLDITHEVANANDIYKITATENGKHYKYITSDSKLKALVEKYQLSQESAEYKTARQTAIDEITSEGGMAKYFDKYVKLIREKKENQIIVNLTYELDGRESNHSVLVDTSRYPANLGDGWTRIFLYNPDIPYFGDENAEGITPLYANNDAMSCYIDVNLNDGSWRTQLGTTHKAMGSEKEESDVLFIPVSNMPSITDASKLTSALEVKNEEVINAEFTGNNIIIYNSETKEEVYKLENGKETFAGADVIYTDYYEINSKDADVSGTISLKKGIYEIVLTDAHISMGQDSNYFSVESEEKVTIDAFEATGFTVTSDDEKSNVKVSIANKESDSKYIACRTVLEVDDKGCYISLVDGVLAIDMDSNQLIDIDVITEVIEGTIHNAFTSMVSDMNIREEILNTDSNEIIEADMPDDGVIPEGLWVAGIEDQIYTGTNVTPDFRVYDGEKLLRANVDYTISYKNNKNVYELSPEDTGYEQSKAPVAIIKAKGNYKGKITVSFKIFAVDISEGNADVIADSIALSYNGKVQNPNPVIKLNNKKLKNGKDYTITCQDENGNTATCKELGVYNIVVTGKGNYSGSRSIKCTVYDSSKMTSLSKVKTSNIPAQTYTGNDITVESMLAAGTLSGFEVKSGTTLLTQNKDYTLSYRLNKNVGTAYVIISAVDGSDYVGQKVVSFKINGIPLKSATINKIEDQTYSQKAIEPELIVSVGTSALVKGVDYKVTYSNNVNAGKAKAVITGIGNYSGTKSITYKINPLEINANSDISVNSGYAIAKKYEKGGTKPSPSIRYNGVKLREGVDYTLSYQNNNKVSEAGSEKCPEIIIKGKGNFKGTVSQPFTITKQDLGKLTISLADKPYKANKSNIYRTKITVIDKNAKTLSGKTDYDSKQVMYTYMNETVLENQGENIVRAAGSSVEKTDVIPSGTQIKVTVSALDSSNYTGSISGVYEISAQTLDISKAKVTVPVQEYTGKAVVLHAKSDSNDTTGYTITFGKDKTSLYEGTDYRVVGFSNNINKGKAKMIIQGIGKYSGTKVVTYNIKERKVDNWWTNFINSIFG